MRTIRRFAKRKTRRNRRRGGAVPAHYDLSAKRTKKAEDWMQRIAEQSWQPQPALTPNPLDLSNWEQKAQSETHTDEQLDEKQQQAFDNYEFHDLKENVFSENPTHLQKAEAEQINYEENPLITGQIPATEKPTQPTDSQQAKIDYAREVYQVPDSMNVKAESQLNSGIQDRYDVSNKHIDQINPLRTRSIPLRVTRSMTRKIQPAIDNPPKLDKYSREDLERVQELENQRGIAAARTATARADTELEKGIQKQFDASDKSFNYLNPLHQLNESKELDSPPLASAKEPSDKQLAKIKYAKNAFKAPALANLKADLERGQELQNKRAKADTERAETELETGIQKQFNTTEAEFSYSNPLLGRFTRSMATKKNKPLTKTSPDRQSAKQEYARNAFKTPALAKLKADLQNQRAAEAATTAERAATNAAAAAEQAAIDAAAAERAAKEADKEVAAEAEQTARASAAAAAEAEQTARASAAAAAEAEQTARASAAEPVQLSWWKRATNKLWGAVEEDPNKMYNEYYASNDHATGGFRTRRTRRRTQKAR
jgi:hypothetical protein